MGIARPLLLLLCAFQLAPAQSPSASITTSQSGKSVTITEPGRITFEHLKDVADTVAVVKIVSGDAENYDVAVYKAEVVQAFKGASVGQTIFFGPFVGQRLGSEYVVFLRNRSAALSPKTKPDAGFGTVHFSEDFDQGYTTMEVSYECVFSGKEIDRQCDYGVRVCTDYVTLPRQVPVSPPRSQEPPFGCRWVRKSDFLGLFKLLS
jgi:hypothetical protein